MLNCMQDGVGVGRPVSAWGAAGLCVALLAATGCLSEEHIKKADGYFQEGVAVLNADQQSAYVSFQKSLQENPRHRGAHYYVALIYATQEKFAEAESEIREVIDIDPDYPEAHNFLGQLLVKLNRRQRRHRLDFLLIPIYRLHRALLCHAPASPDGAFH